MTNAERKFVIQQQFAGDENLYLQKLSERLDAESAELNALLNDGYTLLASHVADMGSGKMIVYTLHRPDAAGTPTLLPEQQQMKVYLEQR